MTLRSHLYVRMHDLYIGILKYTIKSDNGVQLIVDIIYQIYPLSVLIEVQKDLTDFLFTRCGNNETLRNFESRLAAQLAKFNSHDSSFA